MRLCVAFVSLNITSWLQLRALNRTTTIAVNRDKVIGSRLTDSISQSALASAAERAAVMDFACGVWAAGPEGRVGGHMWPCVRWRHRMAETLLGGSGHGLSARPGVAGTRPPLPQDMKRARR